MHSIEWQLFTNFSTIYPRFHREIGDIMLCVIFDRACVDTRDNRSFRNESSMSNELSAAKVEKLIIDAIENNATYLSLQNCAVDRIPDIIGTATSLRTLCISGQQIAKIPESIGNLVNLEDLGIRKTQVQLLPDTIGNLVNLKSLAIELSEIETIPHSIENLFMLVRLQLRANKIETLPDNIWKSNTLEFLDLEKNCLQSISSKIGEAWSLRYLYIQDNPIERLPDTIDLLAQLEILNISNTKITSLPDKLINMSALCSLNLSGNNFKKIPDSIEDLQSLNCLGLNDMPQISDLSLLQNFHHSLQVVFLDVRLPHRYWTKLSDWKSEWLLEEKNVEIKKILIQQIGYAKICEDLSALALDNWREYTLIKLDGAEPVYANSWQIEVGAEPMVLLKMTCPSTGHIHILRVPPEMTSAEAAISWVNWGIHPDEFALQT